MKQKGFKSAALIITVVVIALAGIGGYVAFNQFSDKSYQRSEKGDVEEIQAKHKEDEWQRVIVSLKDDKLPPRDHEVEGPYASQDITRVQEAVLADLTEEDFQLGHQYTTIMAMSGSVSESGMEKLLEHPYVEQVSIDQPMTLDTISH